MHWLLPENNVPFFVIPAKAGIQRNKAYPVIPKIADVLVRQPSFWHSQPTQTYEKLDLTRYYPVIPKFIHFSLVSHVPLKFP